MRSHRQYALVLQNGNLELFRGPILFGPVSEGDYITLDKNDNPDGVSPGSYKVLKTFKPQQAADLEALVELMGWDRVRTLFQFTKGQFDRWSYTERD